MRSTANGHGGNSAHGASNYNGPYMPSGHGMPINLVSTSVYTGLFFNFGP